MTEQNSLPDSPSEDNRKRRVDEPSRPELPSPALASAEAAASPEAPASPGEGDAPASPEPSSGRLKWLMTGARRRLFAGFLSFLWPGLGQLAIGERRAALVFGIPAIVLAIVAFFQVVTNPVVFAVSLWDPTYTYLVVFAVAVFGAWRIASVVHAMGWRRSRPWPRLEAGVGIGLIAVIALTHVAVAGEAMVWYQTSEEIQNNQMLAESSPTPAASLSADPSSTDGTDTGPIVIETPAMTDEPTPEASRAPNPNRITFLLVGLDYQSGRDHSLTDTLMVASLNRETHEAALVSIPRDTSAFPLYWGGAVPNTFKLNTFYNTVVQKRIPAPDPPMTALEKEIGYLLGIPINYYAVVNMDGFAAMINTLGGIDVYNPHAINDPATGIILPAGAAHLNGAQAVLYARSRENGGSDYIRANRQQGMLLSLKNKVISGSGISKINTLLSIAGRSVGTDFPLKTAKDYVRDVQQAKTIKNCVLGPPYSIHPDTSKTGGKWTTYLDMKLVANLSVGFFGEDSLYYGENGVTARAC